MLQHEAVTVSPTVAKPHPTFIAIPSGEASMAFSATSFLDLSMEMAESLDSGRNKWHWDLSWPSNLLPTVVVAYQFPCKLRPEFFQWQGFSTRWRVKLVQYVCIGDCDIKDEQKNVLVHLV